MKIIAITSSPRGRRSNTLRLVKAAAGAAEAEGAEVEIIDIARLRLKYCIGCGVCHRMGKCPRRDGFNGVLGKMLAADGFILSSPNYIDSVSGQMKVFMDRHCDVIHCLRYEGKYSIALSTCGGSGVEHIVGYMNKFMVDCGATALGGAGADAVNDPASVVDALDKARGLGADLVRAIREKREIPEQTAAHNDNREYFAEFFKKGSREEWAANYKYYVENGWIKE